ncbi:MAG TPA: hypothetical protein VLH09_03880 [Bryobacteraceae bacterium]|nr:hypothetical protein [Bryobacteraceae bacterium]
MGWAADGGFGAGIGAIAGAAAGMIGVLATRGKPAEIYPEALLTFRLEAPQAFRQAAQEDYEQTTLSRQRRPRPPRYYYSPWDWWYRPYYPGLFYGPSLYIYSGPRWIGHRGFGRRW